MRVGGSFFLSQAPYHMYNLKLWNKNEEEPEEDIMILEEEKKTINEGIVEANKATKDPFIQNLIESIKNA